MTHTTDSHGSAASTPLCLLPDRVTLAVRLYSQEYRTAMKEKVRDALAAYILGTQSDEQANTVHCTYNRVLALSGIPGVVKGHVHQFNLAVLSSIRAVSTRRRDGGDVACTPAEADDLTAMVELFEQMLDNVPIGKHEQSRKIIVARNQGGHGVYDPATGTRQDHTKKRHGKPKNKKR